VLLNSSAKPVGLCAILRCATVFAAIPFIVLGVELLC
jgi:hypothetical protein